MKNLTKLLSGFVILLLTIPSLLAQQKTFDMNAPVPFDTGTIKGTLDNGITYYIRKNTNPQTRAEFYLVVNAGSILESDAQNGLAHFCEHMAFNGTKNFEKKKIINYLQSIGMKFGPEINAFTSHDVTTYMLQKVPTDNQATIDTALMILLDWASNVSFENKEIDAERGVIHEEWRSGRDAETRMSNNYNKTLFYNSKYAVRNVIGDVNIIDNFPYDTLKKFYKDWYRPDLEAVIAVGDFDPAVIEKKIKTLFGSIPKPVNPKNRTYYEVPDHDQILVDVQKDKEAKYTIARIYYKFNPVEVKNMSYYKLSVIKQLYNMMINERLGELLDEENPPFLYGFSAFSGMVPKKDAYVSMFYAKNNELERGMRTMMEENERVKKFGFVKTELERAKAEYLSEMEQQYKERLKRKSNSFAWEYFNNYLEQEPVPGVDFDYDFIKTILPLITLDDINNLAKQLITDKNRVVIVTAPDKPDVIVPDKDKIEKWVKSFNFDGLKAYVDKISNKPIIPEELMPTAKKVEKTTEDKANGITEWVLKNGAKVVLKQTDFKEDEIMFSAYSLGGSSLYPDKDFVSAMITEDVIANSGVGQFTKTELGKMLAGKLVDVEPFLGELQEGLTGNSSPKDFETMLQLIYLYFTPPRNDTKAYNSFYNRQKGLIENRANDPENAFRDSIQTIMSQHSLRRRPMSMELLGEANYNRVLYIYRDRFTDASDFTFIFVGNIDPKKAKPMIEKYIGGIPSINRTEKWKDLGIRPPKGVVEKTVVKDMKDPKSIVYLSFTGTYDWSGKNRVNLDALTDILEVKLLETIREEEGGTYSPGVWINQTHYPESGYQLNIYFETDPAKEEKLVKIVFDQIKKLQTEGPTQKEVNDVIENKLKEYKENLRENKWWLETIKNHYFHSLEYTNIFDYESRVKALTIETVKEAANSFISDKNYVKVVLMPQEEKK